MTATTSPTPFPAASKLACMLKDEEVVFFCGAGISRAAPANLPLWSEFKTAITEAMALRSRVVHRYRSHLAALSLPMELVLQAIFDVTDSLAFDLMYCLDSRRFNRNHWIIANLLKETNLQTVVTTNFDLLLEEAASAANQTITKWTKPARSMHRQQYEVIKLHGSLEDQDSLIALLQQVGFGLQEKSAELLNRIVKGKTIVVLGYSGHDFDIFPRLQELTASRVIWVYRESTLPEHLHMLRTWFDDRVDFVQGDLNVLLEHVAEQVDLPAFRDPATDPGDGAGMERALATARKWFAGIAACDVLGMAGELLRLAGHTPEAVECFRASLTQARRTGDTQDVYQALSQCAETEETLGHLEKAHAYLNEQHGLLNRLPPDTAHELAFNERTLDEDDLRDRDELLTMEEMLDTPEELIPILNRLSQLYMEDKDYEAAWTTLNREYELSMRIGRVVGALETKLNMAICASDAHEFKRAYALFDELLTWAKNLAIPGFQANIEVNYGLSRLVSDGPKEALPYFQKSLDVFEAIQDVQGIAFASWQVAYVLRMQKRDEEARHYQARADRLMRQAGLTPIVPVFQPDGEDRR